jgi:2-polyprenyl-6-hydroxyphenyl methylase/3-demethylubiquinone-9 3-methyltransferase
MSSNAAEIAFFNQLAEEWWDPKGPQASLHQINPLRLRWIGQSLALHNLQVLDVGCGAGLLSEGLAQMGAHVTGLDLAPDLIRVAQAHAQQNQLHIDYHCEDLQTFSTRHPQHFDAICCLEMLEHVDDFDSIIAQMSHCLKPGGKIFLSTLDRSPRAFVEAIIGAEYLLNLVPRGTHHYNQFIRPEELCASLRQHQLKPIEMRGLRYNPILKTFSLIPKPSTNYMVLAERA